MSHLKPLRLILMRHAKSDWGSPAQRDHERPLNSRGERSAAAMGDWLRAQGYLPDLVLCSDAVRTRETFAGLNLDTEVRFSPALYHASSDQMMGVLRSANAPCVLMIGHNPGIAEFAERLLSTEPAHERFFDYPTCATLVADFEVETWAEVRYGTGVPLAFVIPAEVMQA
ncbi:SixA phosphatase family protein [Thalassovita taeanensis]|uniref:Phosphohistidine phosphatase n=1 Tax=Thalassovita taeanensis TaxID=657014 RepID=A0A1H9DY14_9RHOB|nr:histidine phosphatase family protein [Thalassovita taeanensis]SEQ18207.1 phosphohistidine phosphatase [Thalassovita taeanensis]